jgi:hypothetical protein
MTRRSITAVLCLSVVALLAPTSAGAAANDLSSGLTFPLTAASAEQGTFTGTLRIFRFGVEDGKLVASGIVTGTLVDEHGVTTAIARTVTVPVDASAGAAVSTAAVTVQQVGCGILHLELGPLDLDLLGLVVHLDRVVLDLTAVPGAGNLLGNLLCAITGLLDSGGLLTQIANLLNQLLGLLG